MSLCVDLFAGMGGFSVAAAERFGRVVGVENDPDAVATAEAFGLDMVAADVRDVGGMFDRCDHLHASPPCTTFSRGGRKTGLPLIDRICAQIPEVLRGDPIHIDQHEAMLTLLPAEHIRRWEPTTITFEQVGGVLPIWEVYATHLQQYGYHTWAGLLNSEQYGIPQVRRRAWLIASRNHPVTPPAPTCSGFNQNWPERLDRDMPSWTTMGEALELPPGTIVGWRRKKDVDARITARHWDDDDYRARDLYDAWARPAPTVTGKAAWMDVIIDQIPQRRITLEELCVLQTLPHRDHHGTATSRSQQIANAVPTRLAEHILDQLDK